MGTERIARPELPPVHWPGPAHHVEPAADTTEAVASPGSALPGPARERMRMAFGHDFSDVRVHTDEAANASARAVHAQAYTIGHDIVFAAGRFAPHTSEGERLLAHELGHVVEQRTGRRELARAPVNQQVALPRTGQWPTAQLDASRNELLDRIPAAERAQLRVDTREVTIDGLETIMFDPHAPIPALPQGTVVKVPSGIPTAQQHALHNLARFLVTGREPWLGDNRSITVRLDLGKQGGARSTYRITQIKRGVEHAQREVLVEHLATLGPERDPTLGQPRGKELFDRHGFVRDRSWTKDKDAEFDRLLGALATIPEAMLTGLDGIRFRRVSKLPDEAKEGAEYSREDHSITVADAAFPPAETISAYQGTLQATGRFERLIAHEIGHAIDWSALRGAWSTAKQATKARKRVRQGNDAARDALTAARAESGARFEAVGSKKKKQMFTFTNDLPQGEDNEFRRAAQWDGGTRITDYADKDWSEYYAESFSLYIIDPDGLKRLRPNVYQFFAGRHRDPDRRP